MPVIETKVDMYKLYERGLFGNKLRTWKTPQDCIDENPDCLLGMRYAGPKTGWPVKADFLACDLPGIVESVVSQGYDYDLLRVGERSDDSTCLINGEICASERNYDLHYSTAKTWMRPALREFPQYAQGYKVVAIMQQLLDPASWDDIKDLLVTYPNHVVEFAAFGKDVGVYPHRNTVVWEVRKHYPAHGNEFVVPGG